MSDNPDKIVARTHLHSCYVPDIGNGEDAVVVSEIIETEKGDIRPNLKTYRSPQVRFWTTQMPYRTHSEKKEFEDIRRLDEHRVPFKTKELEMARALKGYTPNFMTFKQRREIMQSPYLYGGNIAVEALIASDYKKNLAKLGKTPHTPTTGFFDTEMSLLKDSYGVMPIMTFTAENRVFVAMHSYFMNEMIGGQRVEVDVDHVMARTREVIDPLVTELFDENGDLSTARGKLPFTYEFFVAENEVDMIRWIVGKMHETKTSFIGVWNINFDMPMVIKILEEAGVPLEDVFADPSHRGTGYTHTSYKPDNRKNVAHHTLKWHWLSATAHFQFVDSMALYSYTRIVDGKEASYKLGYILNKFGLGGKLRVDQTEELEGLQEGDWHRRMLADHFTAYVLYAMWDVMGLQLLEWMNNDLPSMATLCDITSPRFFVNQTIKVTNALFEEWLPKGYVLGTGVDVKGMCDDRLPSEGGAVLEPQNLIAPGMCLFEEWPSHHTNVHAMNNDFDFKAQYPTNIQVLNISKQTMLATIVSINAPHVQARYNPTQAVEVFGSYMVTPHSNGVELGVEMFDLPNYQEMNELFQQHLEGVH